jgi:hypothetical protein
MVGELLMLYVETHWISSCVLHDDPDVEQIPADRAVLRRSNAYVESYAMSRGDALVLATVLEHATTHDPLTRAFLSGNKGDFGPKTPAGAELRRASIKFFSSARTALGFMNANHS